VLYKLKENVSLFVSGTRAFRAPTLNELYRSFRVGNVLTLANVDLRAERLTGTEAGANVTALNNRLNVRGAFFWADVTRPVANVTLQVTPALITRQRQNLGRTRSPGMEVEAGARITNSLSVSGGYQFVAATVASFPANKALEGLSIPQTPRHVVTFQARYSNPRVLTFGLQGRASSRQFDDDQNLLPLDPYFTLDAIVSRRLSSAFEIFGSLENLTGQRYEVGKTPVTTLGPPLLARVGVRLSLGKR
jgi:outer membrane receptor protein involved in Fe transport